MLFLILKDWFYSRINECNLIHFYCQDVNEFLSFVII